MVRFLRYVIVYSLILLLLVFLIGEIKISDEFIIHKTQQGNHSKIAWNLRLIKNFPGEIRNSIIFFGSSVMQGGISDSLLTSAGYKSINFGIVNYGDEVSLYFLNRIKDFEPRIVIFQKKKSKMQGLHKATPLLYSPVSLLNKGQYFNIYFIKYMFKRVALVYEFLFFSISNHNEETQYKNSRQFGVRYQSIKSFNIFQHTKRDRSETANLFLNDFLYNSEKGRNPLLNGVNILWRKLLYHYNTSLPIHNSISQENFTEMAREICLNNGITFAHIYIPEVVDVEDTPDYQRSFYSNSKFDKNIICLNDFSFLNDPIYWADYYHLSKRGALAFTKRLLTEDAFEFAFKENK